MMSASTLLIRQCRACGMNLTFPAGVNEVTCEYCDRSNARPVSDAKEMAQLKYANERRNLGEFDEADRVYRKVLEKNGREHEARWGHLLCKYGVICVEDAAGRKRVITCRRAVSSLMRAEPDFTICCEQAGPAVRLSYQREAEYIDRVQAEIRRIRAENQPYDVFLCYKETAPDGKKTEDYTLALDIWAELAQMGYRVFFAGKSLKQKSGVNYEAAIFAALSDAKVMLVLGTRPEYFEGMWVKSEWKRYLDMIKAGEKKLLLPLYRDLDPATGLPMELSSLQALNMDDMMFIRDLENRLSDVIPVRRTKEKEPPLSRTDAFLTRAKLFLEDEKWDSAEQYAEKVLDLSPMCAPAYMVKVCVAQKVRREADLARCKRLFDDDPNYQKALRFANEEQKAVYENYLLQLVPESVRETLKRAMAGDSEAQYNLGLMYYNGWTVSKDKREAARWYRAAAKQGDANAQYNLGFMYENGYGVTQDMAEAVRLYRAAAEQGHAIAQRNLKFIYKHGYGVT